MAIIEPKGRVGLRMALWLAVLVVAALGLALWGSKDRSQPTPSSSFGAAFGGPFTLADRTGAAVTDKALGGKPYAIFFGFTRCPDVCPTTLAEVAQVMDDLGDQAGQVQPLFISVDPERDRRLGLSEFTTAFHPSILGLAGDAAQTRAAADSFRIHFAREDDAAAPDGYSMSHSPALYLIGPEGDWLRQFTYGTPAAEILADLQSRL